ncbi:MAG: DUF3786 domain-containing protein [Nitrospirota bacterium]
MNPLEIYKRLPGINCGKCTAKTCMAFAMKMAKNEVSLSECTKLTEQGKNELEAMLSEADLSDWKDKFLKELLSDMAKKDLAPVAEGIGASAEGGALKIKYMGKDITVTNSGFNEELGIWDKLLILMYVRNAGKAALTGKWVAFRDLKDGSLKSIGFKESCEAPLAKVFGADQEGVIKRLLANGAEKVSGFTTEYSYKVYPLPKIPFMILLWPAEEDFEPACSILLDSTASEFLDVEALLFLGQALVSRLKR